jgi:hypothetical protein
VDIILWVVVAAAFVAGLGALASKLPSRRRVGSDELESYVRGLVLQYAHGSRIDVDELDGTRVTSVRLIRLAERPSLELEFAHSDRAVETLGNLAKSAGLEAETVVDPERPAMTRLDGAPEALVQVVARFARYLADGSKVDVQYQGRFDLEVAWKSFEDEIPVVEEGGGPIGRWAARGGRRILEKSKNRDRPPK